MRTHPRRLMRAVGLLAAALPLVLAVTPTARSTPAIAPGFAVLELFTSEGCSSCPPADTLLGQLVADAREKHLPVYGLAFHVDYWNQMGWKDPFSAAAFSERQQDYAQAASTTRIYTPQMIVNGTEQFVGSDRQRAMKAIDSALARGARARVELRLVAPPDDAPPDSDEARIAYSVAGAPPNVVLQIAAVEGGLVSSVARGENSGRVLSHESVVRSFLTVALKNGSDGTVVMRVPPGTVAARTSLVAFVQDRTTMAILGATAIAFR